MVHDNAHDGSEEDEQGEQFISAEDILAEVADDGDHPMDEDDDEDGDALGDLGFGPSVTENNSVQIFAEHQGSVFTVSGHPTEPLAASGGEDDLGYIWDITDGEVIVKLTGHTDSVTCTGWSSDGEMISTGGMDGKIRIWRRVGRENYRTWEFLTELQGPDEVMVYLYYVSEMDNVYLIFLKFLRWHPKGNVLLAGSRDSTVWLWQRLSCFVNISHKRN